MGNFCPVTVDWSLTSSSVKPQEIQTKCSYAVPRPERQGVVIFSGSTSHPNPNYVPNAATPSALKKRLNEMVQERLQKRPKVEEGGFKFP